MSTSTREEAQRRINELYQSAWSLSALTLALERGIVRALGNGASTAQLATLTSLPPDVVSTALGVLAALELVTSDGGHWSASPGFAELTAGVGAEILRADLRSTLGINQHFVATAREASQSLLGWHAEDPMLVAAQGVVSEGASVGMAAQLARIPGLTNALGREGAAILDVGAGAAGACIALARHFDKARVVGIEPSATAIAVARENVARAGLEQRIELRQQFGEELTDEGVYDFAYVAQMFIPDAAVDAALRASVRALKKGGVLTTAAVSGPGTELPLAVARFRGVVWGGGVRFVDDVKARLEAAGLAEVRAVPMPPGSTMFPLFGRRP